MNCQRRLIACLVVIGSAYSSSVYADTVLWNVFGGGSYYTPTNWTPVQVPSFGDDVFFQNGSSPTVTFAFPANSDSLTVSTGNVVFSLAGSTYTIGGNAFIGENLGGPLSSAPLATPAVSLAVNGGMLAVNGATMVRNNGALTGNGNVAVNDLIIDNSGQLRGTLHVIEAMSGGGNVLNGGGIAPGNALGVLNIAGNYEQTFQGRLEIEVGGISAGMFDRLSVGGTASIQGRLDLPIVNGFTPTAGQSIPFLPANGLNGNFDFITAPNLPSGVAVRVVTTSGAVANFVAPTTNSYNPSPIPSTWDDPNTWSEGLPDTQDIVNMQTSVPFPTRVNLSTATPEAARAFAHRVNLSAASVNSVVTLGVPLGTSLSALDRVTAGPHSVIEMSGGEIYTNTVQLEGSGQLVGSGTIHGDVIVGTGLPTGSARLAPTGFTSPNGIFRIEEDLTVNSDGTVAVGINDLLTFGQVEVEGTATLGGTLVIDISELDPGVPIGTIFNVVTAGSFENAFHTIETVGGDGSVFFAPADVLGTLGECDVAGLAECDGNGAVALHIKGDTNLDALVNSADASHFIEALINPTLYRNQHCGVPATQAADYNLDSIVDFDDIAFFSAGAGIAMEALFELISDYSVPEPATAGLLIFGCCLLGGRRIRTW